MNGPVLLIIAFALAALFALAARKRIEVYPGEVAVLYRNGKYQSELGPGVHRRFDPFGVIRAPRVSLIPQVVSHAQIEVISKDQFAFRAVIAAFATVVDARAFHESKPPRKSNPKAQQMYLLEQFESYPLLQPTLSATLLRAVAQHTLEELLADPAAALAGVEAEVAAILPGTRLDGLKVTAITLPPETRKMFTEAERARREGLAALERARAEQASLRALANAARTLANNPELARLRMLQTMESARGSKTFVLGQLPQGAIIPSEE